MINVIKSKSFITLKGSVDLYWGYMFLLIYCRGILMLTTFSHILGVVHYTVNCSSDSYKYLEVSVQDGKKIIGVTKQLKDKIIIPSVRPWWPYTMDQDFGFMYTLLVG